MCLCFLNRENSAKALRRPIHFTETSPLSKTLNLIPIRGGWRKKFRLITPGSSETAVEVSFIAGRNAEVNVSDATFYIHKPDPRSYTWKTEGAFQCEIQQFCCTYEFLLRHEGKEYRLVMTNFLKGEYAVCAVEEEGTMVRFRKVMEMKKASKWSSLFKFEFAEELSDEFVACVAFFMVLSRADK